MPDAGMAVPVAVGPLPYNYKLNEAGGFDKFGYSHTATAKEWRDPTEKIATEYERPKPAKGQQVGHGRRASLSLGAEAPAPPAGRLRPAPPAGRLRLLSR